MPGPAILSSEADQDLVGLFSLVAADSGIDRAELILRRIEATIAALADWPGIGRRRDDLEGAPRGFAVPPWLIIYEAQPHDRGIFVWRIVDGRRDLTALIHPPSPA
jgi:toxin ParE1/3/4